MHGDLDASVPIWQRLVSLSGLAVMVAIAWAISYDRKHFPWRIVLWGTCLQLVFGVLVLRTTPGLWLFSATNDGVNRLLGFTEEGSRFVFGDYLDDHFSVALNVLPTIIFFSSLMTVLYHLGVMQRIVVGVAWVMQRTLKTSGAETLSASANIFLGQTEAPLVVKPFIATMTPSELFNVMVCGFATAAGGVLAAYTLMLRDSIPNIAGHLLAATVIQTPAAILLAKIMVPETGEPVTKDTMHIHVEKTDANVIEAAATGAADGVRLAINVAGMLIAFIALIAMINAMVGWAGGRFGLEGLTLQGMLGTLLRPLAWVMGVPWADTAYVGGLIGVKTILNEFVAYAQFGSDLQTHVLTIQPRSALIASYAILGFANFSSIAIQIGGIGGLAPERKSEIARFGLRAMVAGNLAAFMSACWAGMLL